MLFRIDLRAARDAVLFWAFSIDCANGKYHHKGRIQNDSKNFVVMRNACAAYGSSLDA